MKEAMMMVMMVIWWMDWMNKPIPPLLSFPDCSVEPEWCHASPALPAAKVNNVHLLQDSSYRSLPYHPQPTQF